MNENYHKLAWLSKKAALLQTISYLLEWDQETYMPKEAIELKSEQLELLSSLYHKEKTGKPFREALEKLIDLKTGQCIAEDLSEKQKAALKRWRRDFLIEEKLPTEFVEEFTKTTSTSMHAWQDAKKKNSFASFAPYLEKIVDLTRKKADFLGYEAHPYDALLDLFEPETATNTVSTFFERLKIPLIALLKKIETKPDPEKAFLSLEYPHDKQLAFGKQLLSCMGFDTGFSRLDESSHPMCIPLHPSDVRMTTRIQPTDMISNIFSCVHEGGHGLYHHQLPKEHFGTPLGEAVSLGVDESQSRTWETLIGRSLPFWEYVFPKLQQTYPVQLGNVQLDTFYRAINLVEPSLIRVESDEITYNLHVLIRFEIEKEFLEGKLQVKELPEVWNEKMRTYLGISPKADSEGCLQDIHWSIGMIGYFPTYTLGNLYAAQYFETFAKEHPNWREKISNGEFGLLREWQKKHIHQYGRQYQPEELCEKITGKPLSEKPFLQYLENKYTTLYHL
jgi:carboxypeptidase Taq